MAPPALSEATVVFCSVLILFIPLAIAGLALINTGLGRSHSAAHTLFSSLCAFVVAAFAYVLCGFAWQGYAGGVAHQALIEGKAWNWLAAQGFFLRHAALNASAPGLTIWLQVFCVGLAAIVPIGAGLDRWRLSAICASTALFAGITYPVFAHWVWAGGWLAQLGENSGLGQGFVDGGGAACIQAAGGLTALAIAWILGARKGKYSSDGIPTAVPGHSAILVLTGCMLAWIGWMSLNTAVSVLLYGAEAGRAALVAINTTLSAGASGIAAALITRARFGKPDVSISANGWVGGLVASSAAAAFMPPAAAVLTGLIAGALVTIFVELFELRFGVDDPGGAISVHAIGGIWGLFAAGVLGDFPGARAGQLMAQLVGIATLLGFVLPLTYGLNLGLNFLVRHRVAPEGERQGMDLYELGAGAYPEFMTHTEEFTQLR